MKSQIYTVQQGIMITAWSNSHHSVCMQGSEDHDSQENCFSDRLSDIIPYLKRYYVKYVDALRKYLVT
jgi:hypothetical protein